LRTGYRILEEFLYDKAKVEKKKETGDEFFRKKSKHSFSQVMNHAFKVPSTALTLDLIETLIFFRKRLLSSKRVPQNNKENKSLRKYFDFQTLFRSRLVQNSSKEAMVLARIVAKCSWQAKLDAGRQFLGKSRAFHKQ
jgi:hypothetical protein